MVNKWSPGCNCLCCVCDTLDPLPECKCINTAYEPASSAGDLRDVQVTVSGSPTPKPKTGNVCLGPLPAPGTCSDLQGSYVVACGDFTVWSVWTFVGTWTDTDGDDWDQYYRSMLTIHHNTSFFPGQVFAQLWHQVWRARSPSSTPWTEPIDTDSQPAIGSNFEFCGSVKPGETQTEYRYNIATKKRWRYLIGGDCKEACNEEEDGLACEAAGSRTWDTSTSSGFDYDCCNADSYTVELEFV